MYAAHNLLICIVAARVALFASPYLRHLLAVCTDYLITSVTARSTYRLGCYFMQRRRVELQPCSGSKLLSYVTSFSHRNRASIQVCSLRSFISPIHIGDRADNAARVDVYVIVLGALGLLTIIPLFVFSCLAFLALHNKLIFYNLCSLQALR